MLKGISPLLTPDLLRVLAQMGHDDAIVLADANFTAYKLAGRAPVLHLPGVGALHAVQAVCSLLPLAADVTHPVAYMQVAGQSGPSALQREVATSLQAELLPGQSVEAVERYAFYERAQAAFAVVLTGELQPYGNFILRKGVLAERLRP